MSLKKSLEQLKRCPIFSSDNNPKPTHTMKTWIQTAIIAVIFLAAAVRLRRNREPL